MNAIQSIVKADFRSGPVSKHWNAHEKAGAIDGCTGFYGF
jgi:hypothetical protein